MDGDGPRRCGPCPCGRSTGNPIQSSRRSSAKKDGCAGNVEPERIAGPYPKAWVNIVRLVEKAQETIEAEQAKR